MRQNASWCDDGKGDAELAERLRHRPAWREWDEPRIAEMLDYAASIRAEAATMRPPMTLLDTTSLPVERTVDGVLAWLDEEERGRHVSAHEARRS